MRFSVRVPDLSGLFCILNIRINPVLQHVSCRINQPVFWVGGLLLRKIRNFNCCDSAPKGATSMFLHSDVTFYIPCYNADRTICECLQSIRTQSVSPAEILIIDDGSRAPVSIRGSSARVIRHDRNLGLSAARNTALAHCSTRLIAAETPPAND